MSQNQMVDVVQTFSPIEAAPEVSPIGRAGADSCAQAPPPLPLPPLLPPPAPSPSPLPPARTDPLGEADYSLIRQAARRRRAIGGAARTALVSSVVSLLVGFVYLPLACLWPSWDGILVAAGVCVVGLVEYKGYRRMRRADPSAARFLGRNQLAFLGLILFYCVVQLVTFTPEKAKAASLSPEAWSQLEAMPDTMKDINRWMSLATYGFYGLLIVLSVLSQGGLSLYYFTRRRHLEDFHRQTPPWVRRLFAEAMS